MSPKAREWAAGSAIEGALRTALLHARLLIEPAAATALAAAIDHASGLGADVGVVLTGGNIEASLLASLLSSPEVSDRMCGSG